MSIPLTINGAVFEYPQNFDEDWGVDATGWAQAVTAGALYLSGGNFPLTADVDFGSSFGLKAKYLISKTANPASTGYLRLAKSDAVAFRNNANSADLLLDIDGSDMLTFNGSVLGLTSLAANKIFVGDVSNDPAAVSMSGDATIVASGALTIANGAVNNAKVASGAAIAVNKLAAQTASVAAEFDGSGFLAPSATTTTELGYVSGVTSSIQAQINAISAVTVPSGAMIDFGGTAAPTGWLLCDGSSYATATYPSLFAAIGYVWGGSSSTFNVPNMTRRVGMGSGGSGTGVIGNAVGNTGGEETHTLITSEIPAAIGTASSSSSVSDPGHFHVSNILGSASGNSSGSHPQATNGGSTSTQNPAFGTYSAGTGISVSTSTSITNSSGGGAHNNVQPSAIVLKIIKI